MTPKDFEFEMQTLIAKHGDDIETLHYEMDELMCEVLTELGYGKGVTVFENADRWYA